MRIGKVLSLVTGGLALVAAAPPGGERLIGAWQLVRFENFDSAGKVERPYGLHPHGLFVYDASGRLSVQIARDPLSPPFAKGDDAPNAAEEAAALTGYVAYFGTWRINAAKHAVVHVVEASLLPSYSGTDQIRPYTLDGDVLTINVPEDNGGHGIRELHRVR